jgi:hypothetical protein
MKIICKILILILILILSGCATTWTFRSASGKYSCEIPQEISNFKEWPGEAYPIYQKPELSLYVQIAYNPKDQDEGVKLLYAIEADNVVHLVGVYHQKGKGGKYYTDKDFFSGKPASNKLTLDPNPPGTSEIIKIRTGKYPDEERT